MVLTNSTATAGSIGGMVISAGSVIGASPLALSSSNSYPGTYVTLGDANTAANGSSPTLAISGAYSYYGRLIVANQPTAGTYTVAGLAPVSCAFNDFWNLNQSLTVSQVPGGTFNMNNNISGSSGNSVTLTAAGGGTINLPGAISNGSGTLGVNVNNPGGVVNIGNNYDTYTGGTTINAGTLAINTYSGNNWGNGIIAGTLTVGPNGDARGPGDGQLRPRLQRHERQQRHYRERQRRHAL